MSYRTSAAFLDCLNNSKKEKKRNRRRSRSRREKRKDLPMEISNIAERLMGKNIALKISFISLDEVRVDMFLNVIFRVILLLLKNDS